MAEPTSNENLVEDGAEDQDMDLTMLDFEEDMEGYEDYLHRNRGGEELSEEESLGAGNSSEMLSPEERKRLQREYMQLIREIDGQNRTVTELKQQICEMCQKPCRTRCEEREIKDKRCCLEHENLKLQCLIQKAMKLQNSNKRQPWEEIQITTTFEEDSMPPALNFSILKKMCEQAGGASKKPMQDLCSPTPSEEVSKKEARRYLQCLIEDIKQKGPCASKADECTLRKMLAALLAAKGNSSDSCARKKRCKAPKPCASMYNDLSASCASMESDRHKMQEENCSQDLMIDSLQKRIGCMQKELKRLCRAKQEHNLVEMSARSEKCQSSRKDVAKDLEKNLMCMQKQLLKLKLEMECLRKERQNWESQTRSDEPCEGKHYSSSPRCDRAKTKNDEICELKGNYTYLLSEYAKKDGEITELKKRLKGFCASQQVTGANNVDEVELKILKDKVCDLNEEQVEFKCLIKEQADHLEEYRKKYMTAQQKVEEQKCVLDKLQMNNKRIEEQINMEVQRIKSKFQEKLNELAQYPKLLENEQLKLATACKEKEDLESKLRLVCKELKSVKAQLDSSNNRPDCTEELRQVKQALQLAEIQLEDLKREKQLLCEELQKTKEDLDTLRAESARIICGTKERAEITRASMQERIDIMEKELAQCRAAACLSISDREEVIKEMQGQMSTLSYSFDTAQKQIKTLKNHISFLSNDNCFPVKC